MLQYLAVKNFAILENIEVDFQAGMTALTGETGAGKSLLIDAIGLLLGDRASADVVRTGADHCEIKGLFTNLGAPAVNALEALGIDGRDRECMITRQISASSANTIKINRTPVTLQDLRSLTQYLADIHSQHDTKRLINPDTYLSLIDLYDPSVLPLKTQYQKDRENYLKALKDYQTLKNSRQQQLEQHEFQVFQLEELSKHQLEQDEEEALERELEGLRNFDAIFQSLKEATALFNDHQALETIYEASRKLKELGRYDASHETLGSRTESAYYELDDIRETLAAHFETLDFDPQRLEWLETRKHTLDNLKRKYRRTLPELIDFRDTLAEELEQFEQFDETLEARLKTVKSAYQTVCDSSRTLTKKRQDVARVIEQRLVDVLSDLALKETQFNISFKEVVFDDIEMAQPFMAQGTDNVDFLLSTNLGEPLKPLSKVASGGELSRIMLALKELLIGRMVLSLVIFDEIDTGVSGYVAGQVAQKIRNIAMNTQVITITHLPQVAAVADHHYFIYKDSDTSRTRAHIDKLDHSGRIRALAEMMSADVVTEHALKSAQSLLDK